MKRLGHYKGIHVWLSTENTHLHTTQNFTQKFNSAIF